MVTINLDPPCCGSFCEGTQCWDCQGTGHPHDPSRPCRQEDVRHGNRGLGGYQCTCGRFAKFLRWAPTYPPNYETGYVVNCKRCGEVVVR